jgi:hypothetical protein
LSHSTPRTIHTFFLSTCLKASNSIFFLFGRAMVKATYVLHIAQHRSDVCVIYCTVSKRRMCYILHSIEATYVLYSILHNIKATAKSTNVHRGEIIFHSITAACGGYQETEFYDKDFFVLSLRVLVTLVIPTSVITSTEIHGSHQYCSHFLNLGTTSYQTRNASPTHETAV